MKSSSRALHHLFGRGLVLSIIVFGSASCLSSALAQENRSGEERRRAPMARPSGSRSTMRSLRALKKAVHDELELSDDQSRAIEGVFESHLEKTKELLRKIEENRVKNRERMRALRREMSDARRTGNSQRVREIRTQMRELGSGRLELRREQEALDRDIIAELNDSQAAEYRKISVRIRGRTARDVSVLRGLGTTRQIVAKLDLNEEQEARIRELTQKLAKSFADIRRGATDHKAVIGSFREGVLQVLTDEQRQRFLALEAEGVGVSGSRAGRKDADAGKNDE